MKFSHLFLAMAASLLLVPAIVPTSPAYTVTGPVIPDLILSAKVAKKPALAVFDLKSTARLTIIAPHPDDEALGLGGLIYQATQRNIPVSVIIMTNGDSNTVAARKENLSIQSQSDMLHLGATRQQESINALAILGVSKESIYFLSLPDSGLTPILTATYLNNPYTSLSTGLHDSSGYPNSYIPRLPYTGAAARAALASAINATHPTQLFVTMREDQHPDHWASGQFVEDIRSSLKDNPVRYFYIVHYPDFPALPANVRTTLLAPPAKLKRNWLSVPLSPAAENQLSKALSAYGSQNDDGSPNSSFAGFVRTNELLSH